MTDAPALAPVNTDAARIAALTKIIKNKEAQIVANAKLVDAKMIALFQSHLKQAQDELAALVAKIKAAV